VTAEQLEQLALLMLALTPNTMVGALMLLLLDLE
jgi:hypothetical protein